MLPLSNNQLSSVLAHLGSPTIKYHKCEKEEWKNEREKKSWLEPELIVLVRNKPEEAVLGTCKNDTTDDGSHYFDNACLFDLCTDCAASQAS
jgi:hypothetical protein